MRGEEEIGGRHERERRQTGRIGDRKEIRERYERGTEVLAKLSLSTVKIHRAKKKIEKAKTIIAPNGLTDGENEFDGGDR